MSILVCERNGGHTIRFSKCETRFNNWTAPQKTINHREHAHFQCRTFIFCYLLTPSRQTNKKSLPRRRSLYLAMRFIGVGEGDKIVAAGSDLFFSQCRRSQDKSRFWRRVCKEIIDLENHKRLRISPKGFCQEWLFVVYIYGVWWLFCIGKAFSPSLICFSRLQSSLINVRARLQTSDTSHFSNCIISSSLRSTLLWMIIQTFKNTHN